MLCWSILERSSRNVQDLLVSKGSILNRPIKKMGPKDRIATIHLSVPIYNPTLLTVYGIHNCLARDTSHLTLSLVLYILSTHESSLDLLLLVDMNHFEIAQSDPTIDLCACNLLSS